MDFSSFCNANVHYISDAQQRQASKKKQSNSLSSTTSTYAHFIIPLGLHSSAVQLTIDPFTLPNFPAQTFFSYRCRYTLCCSKAPQDIATTTIREQVHHVTNSYYRSNEWDFSLKQYCTLDGSGNPRKVCKATCYNEAQVKLTDYLRSAGLSSCKPHRTEPIQTPESEQLPAVRQSTQSREPTVDGGLQEPNRPASADIALTGTFDLLPLVEVSHAVTSDVADIIANAAAKIRRGLSKLSKKSCESLALPELEAQGTDLDLARFYENFLWTQSEQKEQDFREFRWFSRYLASCFRIFYTLKESEPLNHKKDLGSGVDRTRNDWRRSAELINLLVSRLHATWGTRAYLIYSALAVTGFNFSTCTRKSWDKREDVVSGLVEVLRNEVLSPDPEVTLFDPVLLVSHALRAEYTFVCARLKLSGVYPAKTSSLINQPDTASHASGRGTKRSALDEIENAIKYPRLLLVPEQSHTSSSPEVALGSNIEDDERDSRCRKLILPKEQQLIPTDEGHSQELDSELNNQAHMEGEDVLLLHSPALDNRNMIFNWERRVQWGAEPNSEPFSFWGGDETLFTSA